MQAMFFPFVCTILVIACKDKVERSHLPRVWHEFAVFVKKSQKCSESKFENKSTKFKSFQA